MIYTISIDLTSYHQWSLTDREAFIFCFLFRAPTWAETVDLSGRTMYWVNRHECCRQLSAPGATEDPNDGNPDFIYKPDTVYRTYKSLDEKGIIVYHKFGNKDLFCLTEKGKQWNQRRPLPQVGQKSESGQKSEQTRINVRNNSDKNPTDNSINNNSTNTHIAREEKLKLAFKLITDHFRAFPVMPKKIQEDARVQIAKKEFYKELREWLRYNAQEDAFLNNPVSRLQFGRGSFHNWIRNPRKGYSIDSQTAGQVYDGRA
jgi:hypothetical protein